MAQAESLGNNYQYQQVGVVEFFDNVEQVI